MYLLRGAPSEWAPTWVRCRRNLLPLILCPAEPSSGFWKVSNRQKFQASLKTSSFGFLSSFPNFLPNLTHIYSFCVADFPSFLLLPLSLPLIRLWYGAFDTLSPSQSLWYADKCCQSLRGGYYTPFCKLKEVSLATPLGTPGTRQSVFPRVVQQTARVDTPEALLLSPWLLNCFVLDFILPCNMDVCNKKARHSFYSLSQFIPRIHTVNSAISIPKSYHVMQNGAVKATGLLWKMS